MRRIWAILLMIVIFSIPGCGRRAELASGVNTSVAHVRFINTLTGGTPISITLGAEVVAPSLDFAGFSLYRSVTPGNSLVQISTADIDQKPLLKANEALEGGRYYTALVVGKPPSINILLLTDDLTPAPDGKAKVRYVNAIADEYVQRVDLRDMPEDKVLAKDSRFLQVKPYVMVKSGKHSFELHYEGLETTLTKAAEADLRSGGVYTIVAQGSLFEQLSLEVYDDL